MQGPPIYTKWGRAGAFLAAAPLVSWELQQQQQKQQDSPRGIHNCGIAVVRGSVGCRAPALGAQLSYKPSKVHYYFFIPLSALIKIRIYGGGIQRYQTGAQYLQQLLRMQLSLASRLHVYSTHNYCNKVVCKYLTLISLIFSCRQNHVFAVVLK